MIYLEVTARKIYRELTGLDQLPDVEVPLYIGYAVLAHAKREAVTSEDVHDAWVAWAFSTVPEHPCLRPFNELPEQTQRKDERFAEAIRLVSADLGDHRR